MITLSSYFAKPDKMNATIHWPPLLLSQFHGLFFMGIDCTVSWSDVSWWCDLKLIGKLLCAVQKVLDGYLSISLLSELKVQKVLDGNLFISLLSELNYKAKSWIWINLLLLIVWTAQQLKINLLFLIIWTTQQLAFLRGASKSTNTIFD